jgi:plasmid stabilization system protein ParE
MAFKILWSQESIENLENILEYLDENWTEKESNHFKQHLSKHIKLISSSPQLFPVSIHNSRFRKAVLSKQTTVYYEIQEETIILAFIFNNKRSIKSISE